jgi:hypothetical protein
MALYQIRQKRILKVLRIFCGHLCASFLFLLTLFKHSFPPRTTKPFPEANPLWRKSKRGPQASLSQTGKGLEKQASAAVRDGFLLFRQPRAPQAYKLVRAERSGQKK